MEKYPITVPKKTVPKQRDFSLVLGGPALRQLVRGFADRSHIDVFAELPDQHCPVPTAIETALYGKAQEALTNTHRPSGSSVAELRLRQRRSEIVLEIAGHGHGFPRVDRTGSLADDACLSVGIASKTRTDEALPAKAASICHKPHPGMIWASILLLALFLTACANDAGERIAGGAAMGAAMGIPGGPIGMAVGAGVGGAAGAFIPKKAFEGDSPSGGE